MKKENTTKWVIDASHSEVSFKVKHMMISTPFFVYFVP